MLSFSYYFLHILSTNFSKKEFALTNLSIFSTYLCFLISHQHTPTSHYTHIVHLILLFQTYLTQCFSCNLKFSNTKTKQLQNVEILFVKKTLFIELLQKRLQTACCWSMFNSGIYDLSKDLLIESIYSYYPFLTRE